MGNLGKALISYRGFEREGFEIVSAFESLSEAVLEDTALVFLGDKSTIDVADEAEKITNKFLADMPTLLANKETPEARYSESKCKVCPYNGLCKPYFQANEELTLLYGIDALSGKLARSVKTDALLRDLKSLHS